MKKFYQTNIAKVDVWRSGIISNLFKIDAIKNKKTLYTKVFNFEYSKKNDLIKDIFKISLPVNKQLFKHNSSVFFSDDIVIDLNAYKIVSTNEVLLNKVYELIKKYTPEPVKKDPHVYMFTKTNIVSIGSGAVPFNELNYNDNIIADFNFTVEEFSRKEPFGRLTLLQGSPGTGKTFMIRQLISTVENAMFFYVPSDMVSKIAHPESIAKVAVTQRHCPFFVGYGFCSLHSGRNYAITSIFL